MPEKQIILEMDELLARQEIADYLKVSQEETGRRQGRMCIVTVLTEGKQ